MFTLYSSFGYARFYGCFLLVKHLVVIWLIASTIDQEMASNPATAHLGAPAWVLVGLMAVNGVQILFLLTNMPFNDYIENLVQMVVSLQQVMPYLQPQPRPAPHLSLSTGSFLLDDAYQ